jgi:hypothetical protein
MSCCRRGGESAEEASLHHSSVGGVQKGNAHLEPSLSSQHLLVHGRVCASRKGADCDGDLGGRLGVFVEEEQETQSVHANEDGKRGRPRNRVAARAKSQSHSSRCKFFFFFLSFVLLFFTKSKGENFEFLVRQELSHQVSMLKEGGTELGVTLFFVQSLRFWIV